MATDTEFERNPQITASLRIILPIVYGFVALIGIIGNLIVLQIICANRFRHKSIHLLVLSLLLADFFFIVIFTVVRAVSYAYLNTNWFINVSEWCKAEMYLLRLFEFVLAYTIVFMCLDRAVKMGSCWFGVRKFRSGISIFISIWIVSAYVLIPILLFKQTIYSQDYGGYLCYSTDESVPLFWLGAFPRRTLDFIDIIFRTMLPLLLMIILLVAGLINLCRRRTRQRKRLNYSSSFSNNGNRALYSRYDSDSMRDGINTINTEPTAILRDLSSPSALSRSTRSNKIKEDTSSSTLSKRYFIMVLFYAILFAVCQLPYEIYRSIMLWNMDIERRLASQSLDYAIEIPLLFLKLINRCANPFIFIWLGDIYGLRKGFCRLWCCPCLPGCIGCHKCWCIDCCHSIKYELNHCLGDQSQDESYGDDDWVPTGLQTISTYQYRDGDKLVTKQKILEEYETGIEPYYKNPSLREKYELTNGFVNDTFVNDDNFRLSSVLSTQNRLYDENKRAKL
jgi:hypothetical protein